MEKQSPVTLSGWLKERGLGEYEERLGVLDISSMSQLMQCSHVQLMEIARQLGMPLTLQQIGFCEPIVKDPSYQKRETVRDSTLAYNVFRLLRRLQRLDMRSQSHNWDDTTDQVYRVIDMSKKNPRELIGHIEDALKMDKNNYAAWDIHGYLHARRGYLADARRSFQRALVKNPEYIHARFNHARLLHYELREYDTAKAEYQKIVSVGANFSRAYNSYAKLLEKTGDPKEAERFFRKAIGQRPKSISYRHYLANLLATQKRPGKVQQCYQAAVQEHPRSATLRFHHALALVKCKYMQEAEMEFKNALKLNPESAHVYHEYGKFCERHKDPPDYKVAASNYLKAFQLDPVNFLHAAVDAANLMRRLDTDASRASAEALFKKLVVDAPHLVGAFIGYGKLLMREGRLNEAKQLLHLGIANNPKDTALQEYNAELMPVMGRHSMSSAAHLPPTTPLGAHRMPRSSMVVPLDAEKASRTRQPSKGSHIPSPSIQFFAERGFDASWDVNQLSKEFMNGLQSSAKRSSVSPEMKETMPSIVYGSTARPSLTNAGSGSRSAHGASVNPDIVNMPQTRNKMPVKRGSTKFVDEKENVGYLQKRRRSISKDGTLGSLADTVAKDMADTDFALDPLPANFGIGAAPTQDSAAAGDPEKEGCLVM